MKGKVERQLNFLLPISSAKESNAGYRDVKPIAPSVAADSQKRYIQIKESLKNKGLIKSR